MLALADPAVAELYDKQAADGSDKKYPTTNYVRLELVYFEHRPGTMLDYACGLGANLIHMLECGHTVYGLDTSPHSIRRLQEKVDRTPELSARCHLSTVNKDASRLDLADVQFDYVICASLFSLLGVRERASALLAEFHRVMKPGADHRRRERRGKFVRSIRQKPWAMTIFRIPWPEPKPASVSDLVPGQKREAGRACQRILRSRRGWHDRPLLLQVCRTGVHCLRANL